MLRAFLLAFVMLSVFFYMLGTPGPGKDGQDYSFPLRTSIPVVPSHTITSMERTKYFPQKSATNRSPQKTTRKRDAGKGKQAHQPAHKTPLTNITGPAPAVAQRYETPLSSKVVFYPEQNRKRRRRGFVFPNPFPLPVKSPLRHQADELPVHMAALGTADTSKAADINHIGENPIVKPLSLNHPTQPVDMLPAPAINTAAQQATRVQLAENPKLLTPLIKRELFRMGCFRGRFGSEWDSSVKTALWRYTQQRKIQADIDVPTRHALDLLLADKHNGCGTDAPEKQRGDTIRIIAETASKEREIAPIARGRIREYIKISKVQTSALPDLKTATGAAGRLAFLTEKRMQAKDRKYARVNKITGSNWLKRADTHIHASGDLLSTSGKSTSYRVVEVQESEVIPRSVLAMFAEQMRASALASAKAVAPSASQKVATDASVISLDIELPQRKPSVHVAAYQRKRPFNSPTVTNSLSARQRPAPAVIPPAIAKVKTGKVKTGIAIRQTLAPALIAPARQNAPASPKDRRKSSRTAAQKLAKTSQTPEDQKNIRAATIPAPDNRNAVHDAPKPKKPKYIRPNRLPQKTYTRRLARKSQPTPPSSARKNRPRASTVGSFKRQLSARRAAKNQRMLKRRLRILKKKKWQARRRKAKRRHLAKKRSRRHRRSRRRSLHFLSTGELSL